MSAGGRVDLTVFTPAARQAFQHAVHEAHLLHSGYLGVEHLFLGVLAAGGSAMRRVFEEAGLDPERLERVIRGWLRTDPQRRAEGEFPITPRLERVQGAALLQAAQHGSDHLGPVDLMAAIVAEARAATTRILVSLRGDQLRGLRAGLRELQLANSGEESQQDLPSLTRFGIDLSEEAALRDSPVLGREAVLAAVMARIESGDRPVILGEPGVGKGALIRGLARALREPGGPERLRKLRLIEISQESLRFGLRRGPSAPDQVAELLAEAEQDERVLLFLRDIDLLLEDREDGVDRPLRDAITRGSLRCIASATLGGWSRLESQEPAVSSRLVEVEAAEPSASVALRILHLVRGEQEDFHRVVILEEAVRAALVLARRFLPERRLPGKAIEVLEQACAQPVLAGLAPREDGAPATPQGPASPREIGTAQVAEAVSRASGVPVARILARPVEVVEGLEAELEAAVVGQADARAKAVEAVRQGRHTEFGPRISLLLLGPAGVGKYELARCLANRLYGHPQRILRLDMEEYAGSESLLELTGDPAARGFGREGLLVGRLRRAPWSMLYLDHVDRADSGFLEVLAAALESGTLAAANGHRAQMEHATLILASHEEEAEVVESLPASLRRQLDATLRFHPLGEEELHEVGGRRLRRLQAELRDRGVELNWHPAVLEFLVGAGADRAHGARTLLRAVDRHFTRPVRRLLHEDPAPRGLRAELRQGQVVFLADDPL